MLDSNQLYRLIVLFAVGGLFWFLSYSEHRNGQMSEQEKIHLPKFMFLFFGKPRNENIYSLRGILGQLFVYAICFIYILLIIGKIEKSDLARFFVISVFIIVIIGGMLYFINKVKS